jgi:L-lactate dehydrogenase (cytochrome)
MKPLCIEDFRALARRRLPHFLFEYIDGGSYAELTLRRNVSDLEAIALRQRVLRDVSAIVLKTNLLGRDWAMPVALGPIGLAGMNARRGEVQAACAAEAAGIPFSLSTVSLCPLDEVAAAVRQPFWFQLYAIRDRSVVTDMIARAKALGCDTLLFTVDLPMPGVRYRDYRSGLAGASSRLGALRRLGQVACRPRWAWDVGLRGRPHRLGNVASVLGQASGMEDFLSWLTANFDPAMTWRDIAWLRAQWPGRLLIKGILDPGDAREAIAAGVDGIVVSNHGGRQLDGVPSTARALPAVVQAVAGQVPVLADGGVRSGLDVVRMLALGANGVLLGRAWAYALAAEGGAGVARMLALIAAEMRIAMALTGVDRVSGIDAGILVAERQNE